MKDLLILSGATATGKTQIAIEFSILNSPNVEIVNFDSLLFYRELNIATAKPTISERQGVPHHLIDISSIDFPIDAAQFVQECDQIVADIHQRGKIPLLVGGSGFYLQAFLEGMFETATPSLNIISKSESIYKECGISPFIEELISCDPLALEKIHHNDHYRLRRAVEHFWTTGIPWSAVKEKMNQAKQNRSPYFRLSSKGIRVTHAYLAIERKVHQSLIEQRTQKLLKDGLLEEIQHILHTKPSASEMKPMHSIGAREAIDYLQGNIPNQLELVNKITISTRQLAKAQRTWFNRDKNKHSFNPLTEKNKLFQFFNKLIS